MQQFANILKEDVVYSSGIKNKRWLASTHRAIMRPREAFPHCHVCAAQNRDLKWARAASQRYSERPAETEISEVSRLHDG